MKRLLAILVCMVGISGCTWDDLVATDKWLDSKVKVGNPFTGPFSHKAIYKHSVGDPYMTPID